MMQKLLISILLTLILMPSVQAIDESQIEKISDVLVDQIIDSFPKYEGQVLSIRGENGVYINLGEIDGLKAGERFEVFSQGSGLGRDSEDNFVGYDSERIALVEVRWIQSDYSYTEIIERYSDTPIDHMDLLHYIQPVRTIYVGSFDGQYAGELKSKITSGLREISYFDLKSNENHADCKISGEIVQKAHGLDIRLFLTDKLGKVTTLEKRFIIREMETPSKITADGYSAYSLDEIILDFKWDEDEIILLGESNLHTVQITSDGIKTITRDKITNLEKPLTREPIGRLGFFDLDGDNKRELLMGRTPSRTSRYYSKVDNIYALSGPLPGIPLGFFKNECLLFSKLSDGYNLFDPSSTSIINVSTSGFGNQIDVLNIDKPFVDACLIDTNLDNKAEIIVLYSDGSLVWSDPFNIGTPSSIPEYGAGIGLYVHTDNSIFASSSGDKTDRVHRYIFSENKFTKVSESDALPYYIYRIGEIDGRIAALALDKSDRCYLLVFENLLKQNA